MTQPNEQPNQFAAVLPNLMEVVEMSNFMNHKVQQMYGNGAAMVADMEKNADSLRREKLILEQEHAVRMARIQNLLNTQEAMIAHHLGVMRPEPELVAQPANVVKMIQPQRNGGAAKPKQRRFMGMF